MADSGNKNALAVTDAVDGKRTELNPKHTATERYGVTLNAKSMSCAGRTVSHALNIIATNREKCPK